MKTIKHIAEEWLREYHKHCLETERQKEICFWHEEGVKNFTFHLDSKYFLKEKCEHGNFDKENCKGSSYCGDQMEKKEFRRGCEGICGSDECTEKANHEHMAGYLGNCKGKPTPDLPDEIDLDTLDVLRRADYDYRLLAIKYNLLLHYLKSRQ